MKRTGRALLTALLCLLFTAGCTQPTVPVFNPSLPLPEADYPLDLLFSSGAGAWGTRLTLHADGSFSGLYHDSDMGDGGPGYPNGTAYTCSFAGSFLTSEPLDEFSYRLYLSPPTLSRPAGEEWVENGIRYFSTGPHGLEDSLVFVLYTPGTPVEGLDEEFLSWWPGRFADDPPKALDCYALWNVETGAGFFAYHPGTPN